MKRRFILSIMLIATTLIARAQMSPENYDVMHSDSCWYFTFDYDTPKMPKDEGLHPSPITYHRPPIFRFLVEYFVFQNIILKFAIQTVRV